MSDSESYDDSSAPAPRTGPPKVPKLATPLPGRKSPTGPMSPLSPTGQALASFHLHASELRGVKPDRVTGEVEIDGIPEEDWDIDWRDLAIEKELAEGTFGRVYLGNYFGTQVAIKLLFQADMVSNIGKYILRELAMLRAVQHPNVVQFLGLCRHNDEVFVVTEYVANGDLMELLHNQLLPPLSWSLRVHLMMEITKPVAYLHSRNIVHRDIKLENVLVGQNWAIKLCDFGFARCMDNSETRVRDHTMRKMTVAGTDQWMAPEVFMQQPYNEQADVFSLGCTFFEILCRKQPPSRNVANHYAFDVHEFLQSVEKNTPKELVMLVLDMCQLKPGKRPTATQVLSRLRQVAASLPPVDLSEGNLATHLHPKAQTLQDPTETNDSSVSADANNNFDHEDDEDDEDSFGGRSPKADPKLMSLQLRRAMSADSGSQFTTDPLGHSPSSGSTSHSRIAEAHASTRLRYEKCTVQIAQGLSVHAGPLTVTSSIRPRTRKFHAVLISEGSLFLFRSEKLAEQSFTRIFLEQQSVVSHTDREEVLRISTPVVPDVFWLLDCKTSATASKWYNVLLGVIMRSDVDYHYRLKSGCPFGWSPASRGPGTACFQANLTAPYEASIVLALSEEKVRLLVPFTEEISAEWDFEQLTSYALSAGGQVDVSIMEASGGKRFGKSKGAAVKYQFDSPLAHKEIYEKLEELFASRKAKHDALFREVMESGRGGGGSGDGLANARRDKGKRMSLNLGSGALFARSSDRIPTLPPRGAREPPGAADASGRKSPTSGRRSPTGRKSSAGSIPSDESENGSPSPLAATKRGRSTTFSGLFKKNN